MILLGITGGIGSGKSYVAGLLQQHWHIPVYDCDSQAKRLTAESPRIRQALIELVGPQVYDARGLVRPALAAFLFAGAEQARQVEAIIHPAVRDDLQAWARTRREPIVAVESAILYESGFDREVHHVLFVDSPQPLRLRRAMQRDGATEQQIMARMRQQQTEQNRQRARFVVTNAEQPEQVLLQSLARVVEALTSGSGQPSVS